MNWRLSIHDDLPSTQDAVLAAAQAGEGEGFAVLARRQSAGRGTQGRAWRSPPGNLFLSLLLRPAGPARELPQWSLLAGLAVAEAISAHLPDPAALRLKWPNDVLLDGAKCAGILTQGQPDAAGGIAWLAFGIGVNLAEAPQLPDRPTASLAQHAGRAPEVVAFAWALLARLDHWRQRQQAEGFAPVRAAWVARGPALRAPLALRRPEGELHGLYQGLTEDGRLLLCSKDGPVAVASGEVAG
ncbi:biotin--[acetyl-CoA-carboxylase] ligase [Pseudoroseomonas cervicalis]|uniref:biotin--[biotin carboxyl-carrier protein] ligase n=1 Tax=Pseudoroseomonas cervicalis ATCC 49957 TaxID=525371 RepID=D5RRP1_9PROT|nr:biotin--[acetyl-CoA-carboxylase] ligase [Pseudoroseomonas cervicalis]EFH10010.1 biotin--[acetyl-CoA-carboxylase] ligase [Pseudoroseomonas cervicalis ATCC 49957]